MTLKDLGFRFMVSQDRKTAKWVHPAEVSAHPGWIDCTDMGDADFLTFMTQGA